MCVCVCVLGCVGSSSLLECVCVCVCVLRRVGSSSLFVWARVRMCACMFSRSVVSNSLQPHVLQP